MPTVLEPIMYEPRQRELEVAAIEAIGRRMKRVTLRGENLKDFTSHGPADHVKLVVPDDSGNEVMRDYTIRRHDQSEGELDIDIVLHDGGVVTAWLARAEIGDGVATRGPRGSTPLPIAEHYVLIADMTALPCVARAMEEMPPQATGEVLLVVSDEEDELRLEHPEGVSIQWAHATSPAGISEVATIFAARVDTRDRDTFVWAGGEVLAMRSVRDTLRDRGLLDVASVNGYWRAGVDGYDHHEPL